MGVRLKVARCINYSDVPSWQQSNEYLLSGYRPPSGSVQKSLRSLLYLHNETVNIYSHLLGALLFLAFVAYFYSAYYLPTETATIFDLTVFSIYLVGVAICFLFSAAYHTLDNHSASCSSIFNHLDYLGIVVLMWGASVATIYYGFYCNRTLQFIYWATVSFLALACAGITLKPEFRGPKLRVYRTALYTALGLSGLAFVIHGLVVYGWEVQDGRMALGWMLQMACTNLIGAATFATRVPERWVPYRFDIFGASHQLLHMAVLVAAVLHFVGLLSAFDYVHRSTC